MKDTNMIDWRESELGEHKDIRAFELTGRLDAMSCDYLYSVLDNRIRDDCRKMVLDCHGLEYISSIGLGMLLRVHARMKKRGGDVKLARIRGMVADVFRVVNLDKLFHVYSSVEEAIRTFDE